MKKDSFVTIAIPTYNRPEYLDVLLESITKIRTENFDIVISDDCSPRQTEIRAIIKRHSKQLKIEAHYNTENIGEAKNRDNLLKRAKGEWVLLVSDDDLVSPDIINIIATKAKQHVNADMMVFGFTKIDEHNNKISTRVAPKTFEIAVENRRLMRVFLEFQLFPYAFYQPANYAIRRDVALKIATRSTVGIADDLMYQIDFLNAGHKILVVSSVATCYRKFSSKSTYTQKNQSASIIADLAGRVKILRQLKTGETIHENISTVIAEPKYSDRFVHFVAMKAKTSPSMLAKEVELTDTELTALRTFCQTHALIIEMWKLRIRNTLIYVNLFGLSSIIPLLRMIPSIMPFRK